MKQLVIGAIRLYQRTLSPDHGKIARGPFVGCKYYPSCSEYTVQAIEKYGVLRGGMKGSWRILRCNPFSHGGVDELK